MAKQTVVIKTKKKITIKPKSRSELSQNQSTGIKNKKLSEKAKSQKRGANGQFI